MKGTSYKTMRLERGAYGQAVVTLKKIVVRKLCDADAFKTLEVKRQLYLFFEEIEKNM